jgi:hypothetical protein
VPIYNVQITRAGLYPFEEKDIIHQVKRTTRRVNLSKLFCPTSEGKCPLFKGQFRGLA